MVQYGANTLVLQNTIIPQNVNVLAYYKPHPTEQLVTSIWIVVCQACLVLTRELEVSIGQQPLRHGSQSHSIEIISCILGFCR